MASPDVVRSDAIGPGVTFAPIIMKVEATHVLCGFTTRVLKKEQLHLKVLFS